MHNLEVWNMALSEERELDRGQRRLERSRHTQDAIARSTRPRGIWHRVAAAVRLPRATREFPRVGDPRVAAAKALAVEAS